jgi:hypothetical protein
VVVRSGWGRSIFGGRGGDASAGSCWGDQAVATQCSGQPLHEDGEDGPVRPVHAWSWVGAAQDADLVPAARVRLLSSRA